MFIKFGSGRARAGRNEEEVKGYKRQICNMNINYSVLHIVFQGLSAPGAPGVPGPALPRGCSYPVLWGCLCCIEYICTVSTYVPCMPAQHLSL